jgi:hypothetical protein
MIFTLLFKYISFVINHLSNIVCDEDEPHSLSGG